MKSKLIDEIKSVLEESKNWVKLEVEYAKLTVAEKLTMLLATLIIGFIALLLGVVVLIMLAFALSSYLSPLIGAPLAFLSTAGAICLCVALILIFRRQLLLNPIARMITRIFFDKGK